MSNASGNKILLEFLEIWASACFSKTEFHSHIEVFNNEALLIVKPRVQGQLFLGQLINSQSLTWTLDLEAKIARPPPTQGNIGKHLLS